MVEQRTTAPSRQLENPASAFVGRDIELEELRAGLRDAQAGRGRLALISGDPGIGKTRLASEVAAQAAANGYAVHWGRCWEGGGAPAYWPWLQVLRALARVADHDTAAAARALLAALSDDDSGITGVEPAVPQGTLADAATSREISEQSRFALFDRAAEFLGRVSSRQPQLIIFDDLHAADTPSLLLLQFMAREIQNRSIMLLGTYREAEARDSGRLASLLTRISRWGRTLPLRGLTESETGALIHSELAAEPSASLVHAIYAVTEGNPFFTDEIARLLRAEGQLASNAQAVEIRIPHAVRETIQQRLQPLTPESRQILAAAAVIGREFDLDRLLLASAAAADASAAALAAGERLGLLFKRGARRFGFAHALIRETLYESLTLAERCLAHRRLAEGLVRRDVGEHPALLADLAYHFSEAGSAVCGPAIDYCERAGQAALQAFGYESAAEHFKRALEIQAQYRPADRVQRAHLLLSLGQSYARAWETAEARQALLEAVDLGRALQRSDLLARAVFDIGALELGVPRGSCDSTLVALIEEALAALGSGDSPWRARLMGRLATELHFSPAVQRRDDLTRQAIAIAERCGDEATLAYVLSTRHFALWSTAPHDERSALADAVVLHAMRAGDRELTLQGHTWRVLDLVEIGDPALDEALALYQRLASELRQPRYLGMAYMLRGMRAQWQGDYAEAERLALEALNLGERVGDPGAFANAHVLLFAVRRDQGRLAEIEPLAQAGAARFPDQPVARCFLALVQAELGRTAEARAILEALACDGFEDWRSINQRGTLLGTLPTVAALCGARDAAEKLYRFALRHAGTHLSQGPNAYFGPCDLQIGTLAALLDRPQEALEHFERAVESSRRCGARPWIARSLHASALVLGSLGNHLAQCRTLLDEALQIAEALQMTSLAERIRAQQASPHEAATAAAPETMRAPDLGGAGAPLTRLEATFRRDGDYWTIAYGQRVSRLRDSKGLAYLSELLRRPRRDLHVLELDLAVNGAAIEATPHPDANALQQMGLRVDSRHDDEPVLDARAREAYRARLEALRDQLEIATELHDSDRSATLQAEIDALAEELAAGIGLGGRHRKRASAAELVRQNVSRAIKSAITRIRGENPELALYLDATIKKGAFCSYNPDSRVPVRWTL